MLYLHSLKADILKKEGFSVYSQGNEFAKRQQTKFWDNTNKALSINSEFGDFSEISKILETTDTLNNAKNKSIDYNVFFEKDNLPGAAAKDLKCSSALEPKLMPPRNNEYGTGCGWWYMDDDSTPSVGSYGTSAGPMDTGNLANTKPGGIWMWDLEAAQKKEDVKRCRRIKSCEIADLVPGKCGFCTTFLSGVPVKADGNSLYPNDPSLNCDGSIVTNPNKCPRPTPPSSDPNDPRPSKKIPGLCDPNPATGQLSRPCLITLAKGAGCTDNSVIISILSGDSDGYYSQPGTNNERYKIAIQTIKSDVSLASPKQFYGYGVCTRSEALGYYNSIIKTAASGSTVKSRAAAAFLAYGDSFDECGVDSKDTGPFTLHCLEKVAREVGCQPDGTDYPVEVIRKVNNNIPKACGLFGSPSSDGNIRIYSKKECDSLGGNFYPNGECLKATGGSYSWDCRELNKMPAATVSTKDKYDAMSWGGVLQYFKDLYQNMHSSNPEAVAIATKKCLGITIAQPDPDCGDVKGISYYCYKWEYDYNVSSGKIPTSVYYGRMYKSNFIEIANNGPYTNFNVGTDRIHLRVKGQFKNKTTMPTKIWVQTDDGIAIRLNGNSVLQKWVDQGPTSYETPDFVMLENKPIPFEIDWYNNYGGYVFATRLWQGDSFKTIPDSLLRQSQPSGYPIARWDFFEGIIEDRCRTLNSQVIGNVPFSTVDGKKCMLFTDKNYIEITNGIAETGFRSITMMVYLKSAPSGYPRFWEFNNTKLGDNGNWCQDSIFGTASPGNSMGMGYYCMMNCNRGPSQWSGAKTIETGKWYHMVWTIDSTGKLMESYLDGNKVTSMRDETGILQNKTYRNMYIMNSVELFNKDMAVAWFRIYDYTLTPADIRTDRINGFSNDKLFPMSSSSGWTK